jgi:preprotein translocase subunit SecB
MTIATQDGFSQNEGDLSIPLKIDPSFRFAQREKGDLRIVTLQVTFGSEDASHCPYVGRVKGTGIFTLADGTDKDEAEQLVILNGTSMVFGMLRGIVAQITAQGWHGSMLLPTVNFIEFFESLENERTTADEDDSPRDE